MYNDSVKFYKEDLIMKKRIMAVVLCVAMLFSFAALTVSAAETDADSDISRNEEGLITPANWTQFLMALFVRLFEIISGLLG